MADLSIIAQKLQAEEIKRVRTFIQKLKDSRLSPEQLMQRIISSW